MNDDPRGWEVKVVMPCCNFHSRLERRMSDGWRPWPDAATVRRTGDALARRGITQQELAERLLVTKANVVGLIDRVSPAGWVERRADPEDRRVNRLYLTNAGRKLAARHSLIISRS